MSAPAFFRHLPPMKRREIAPLVLLFLAAGLIVIFAKITGELLEGDLHGFDRAILLALRHPGDSAKPLGPLWLQVAARDITSLGSPAVLTLITGAVLGFLALKRQWRAALFVLISICGGSAVSFALARTLSSGPGPRSCRRRGPDPDLQLPERPRLPIRRYVPHAGCLARARAASGRSQGLSPRGRYRDHGSGRDQPRLYRRALADGRACRMVRGRRVGDPVLADRGTASGPRSTPGLVKRACARILC